MISFPYKTPGLGMSLVVKGIPLPTTLAELKEKIPHFFVWVLLPQISFRMLSHAALTSDFLAMIALKLAILVCFGLCLVTKRPPIDG